MSQDPLAQLRDIHLPEPVSWWPPAPGWWILFFLILLLLGWGGYLLYRAYQNKRYRQAALKELAILKQQTDQQNIPTKVCALLKRVAIHAFGRNEVANLSGEKWLEFLDRTGKTDSFQNGPGQALGKNLYRPEPEVLIEPLFQLAKKWIRGHKKC